MNREELMKAGFNGARVYLEHTGRKVLRELPDQMVIIFEDDGGYAIGKVRVSTEEFPIDWHSKREFEKLIEENWDVFDLGTIRQDSIGLHVLGTSRAIVRHAVGVRTSNDQD